MPAVSKKQERFMQAVANNPKFAKKAGVPQSVGREFTKKDGGQMNENKMMKKEGRGMAKADMQKAALKKHASMPASKAHAGLKKGGAVGASKMGPVKTSSKPDGIAMKGKTKGTMVKMAGGGMMKKGSRGC